MIYKPPNQENRSRYPKEPQMIRANTLQAFWANLSQASEALHLTKASQEALEARMASLTIDLDDVKSVRYRADGEPGLILHITEAAWIDFARNGGQKYLVSPYDAIVKANIPTLWISPIDSWHPDPAFRTWYDLQEEDLLGTE